MSRSCAALRFSSEHISIKHESLSRRPRIRSSSKKSLSCSAEQRAALISWRVGGPNPSVTIKKYSSPTAGIRQSSGSKEVSAALSIHALVENARIQSRHFDRSSAISESTLSRDCRCCAAVERAAAVRSQRACIEWKEKA